MRCPKCGYNSFDYNDICPKCSKDISKTREMLALLAVQPQQVSYLQALIGDATAEDEFEFVGTEQDADEMEEVSLIEEGDLEEGGEEELSLPVEDEGSHEIEFHMDGEDQPEEIALESEEISFEAEEEMAPLEVEADDGLELSLDMGDLTGEATALEEEPDLEIGLEPEEETEPEISLQEELVDDLDSEGTLEFAVEPEAETEISLEEELAEDESLEISLEPEEEPELEISLEEEPVEELAEDETLEISLEPEEEAEPEIELEAEPAADDMAGETLIIEPEDMEAMIGQARTAEESPAEPEPEPEVELELEPEDERALEPEPEAELEPEVEMEFEIEEEPEAEIEDVPQEQLSTVILEPDELSDALAVQGSGLEPEPEAEAELELDLDELSESGPAPVEVELEAEDEIEDFELDAELETGEADEVSEEAGLKDIVLETADDLNIELDYEPEEDSEMDLDLEPEAGEADDIELELEPEPDLEEPASMTDMGEDTMAMAPEAEPALPALDEGALGDEETLMLDGLDDIDVEMEVDLEAELEEPGGFDPESTMVIEDGMSTLPEAKAPPEAGELNLDYLDDGEDPALQATVDDMELDMDDLDFEFDESDLDDAAAEAVAGGEDLAELELEDLEIEEEK